MGEVASLHLSVGQTKDWLEKILKTQISSMLWGPPGIGKSAIVNQLATERGLKLIDIRLAQMDPIEVKGIPTPNGNRTKWLTADFLPTSGEGIIFLDELTCAPPAVQNAALQLILDRRLHQYEVPEGWRIVAAGNKAEHGAFVSKMSLPMKNRMVHVEVFPHWEDTKKYFKNRVRPEIISFLDWRSELLHMLPKTEECAFPTPRSWETLSTLLNSACRENSEIDISLLTSLAMCSVGGGAAVELASFVTSYVAINPMAILEKGTMPIFEANDVALKYAATGAVSYTFLHKVKKLTEAHVNNFFTFLDLLEPEFQIKVMKDMEWIKHRRHFDVCYKHNPEVFERISQELRELITSG